MLKGNSPSFVAAKSLAQLSKFPNQVVATAGTGDLMRSELKAVKAIETPIDPLLTKRLRQLLVEVDGHNTGRVSKFPLNDARILKLIGLTRAQRLNHAQHQSILRGVVKVLCEQTPHDLRAELRKGHLTNEIYGFLYQTGFLALRNALASQRISEEKIKKLYFEYSLLARTAIVFTLFGWRWFQTGGAENMLMKRVTNEVIDIDYVVNASYFDGILSNEKRVNHLYGQTKTFLEYRHV